MAKVLPNHTHELIALANEPYLENKTASPTMKPTKPAKLKKRKRPKYSDEMVRCAAFLQHGERSNTQIYGDAEVLAQGGMDYWVQGWVKVDIHQVYNYMDRIINLLAQKGDMRSRTILADFASLSIMPTGVPTSNFVIPRIGTVAASPIPKPSQGSRKSK
jgi:hypothetical protein